MATARPKGKGYEIRVFCGVDADKKRIDRSRTWVPEKKYSPKQLERELERQKALFEEEVKGGKAYDRNMKFGEFAKRWMDEYAKVKLTPNTVGRYADFLKRINPAIGHIRLSDLKAPHLNSFYRNLSEDNVRIQQKRAADGKRVYKGRLAPKTILEHHRLISKILATAIKWQLLDINVATRADPPKVPHQDVSFLNEQEARQMILALDKEPMQYRTMILLLIYTGMRRGELMGLEWKDIDLKNGQITIVRTSQYIGNKTLITKDPKTHAGQRRFSIGQSVVGLLTEYRKWQNAARLKLGDKWVSSDRLFTAWDGSPMYPDTLTKWFGQFLKRHGFGKVTLHSLRHTNATLMIAEGTDIRTVSNRLGHAQTSTTLNIYAHALKSKDKDAAEKLEIALER